MTSSPELDMTGKVVAITGANSGIGLATAEALARLGATVFACGRDAEKLDRAAATLRTAANGGRIETFVADLASVAHVRELAAAIARRTDRLDVLIHNAGVTTDRQIETEDAFELTFAVNVLAPFVLTTELLPLLTASAPARVITVTSAMHASVRSLDLEALQRTNGDRWFTVYARAKLASLLFSNELARRLDGTGVTSNVLVPGMIATGFGGDGDLGGINAFLNRVLNRFLPGPEVGARTPLHLAKAPELEGVTGRYFEKGAERVGRRRSARERPVGAVGESHRRLRNQGSDRTRAAGPHPPSGNLDRQERRHRPNEPRARRRGRSDPGGLQPARPHARTGRPRHLRAPRPRRVGARGPGQWGT